MRERILQFGKKNQLTGVLCEPDLVKVTGTAIIFLNSGLLHHVGACRLHVALARDLAKLGLPSIRFDHSGVGDSAIVESNDDFITRSVAEVKTVLDSLQTSLKMENFILFGLCSGADTGFYAALQDNRVSALVQLDPYVYRTPKYYLTHYLPRLRNIMTWQRAVKRLFSKVVGKSGQLNLDNNEWYEAPEYIRVFPEQHAIAQGLQQLVARKVAILNIFSGGSAFCYNYKGQLKDCFKNILMRANYTEEFFPGASHIFTQRAEQKGLRRVVADWLVQTCLGDQASQPAEPSLACSTAQVPGKPGQNLSNNLP